MEKNPLKISKSNSSTSLPIVHSVLKNYPTLSRCNSFSSTSSDSAVYCGSAQTNLKNGKRLANDNQSTELPKRSRNSSGSSVSSNMSFISDKDLKSSVLPQSPTKSPLKNNIIKNVNPPLNLVNGKELKDEEKETAKDENISISSDSIMLPSQRILRRQITKKGCACCPSTRTTVVVRRYQEIFKTSKKKTVISSTKVKTFVQKSSLSNSVQIDEDSNKASPKSGAARKRRSEVEKLYESLHEIEWAKNFSPDNILRQINVRQAASCSVFGRCHAETLQQKNSKRQKSTNSSCNESPLESANSENDILNSTIPSKEKTSSEIRQHCDRQTKISDSKTKQTSDSNTFLCEPHFKSCDSQSSVNITCSVSHINVKEINIKSTESVHHTQSLLTVNGEDYSDDAQLSYTSDESSSAISSSIVNLQSKHLLDLDYKDRTNRDSSDVDVSELSATPTFFDIAEEGIRTIDACFREVGAEVVVSTCYDENSLPSLQSAGENATRKGVNDDCPPILKPCISTTSNQNSNSKSVYSESLHKEVISKGENIKNCLSIAIRSDSSDSGSFNSDTDYAKFNTDSLSNCYSYLVYKNNRDLLLLKTGRKILNKYLKFLYSKSQPKPIINFFSYKTTNVNGNLSEQTNNHDISSEQFDKPDCDSELMSQSDNCDIGSEQFDKLDSGSEQFDKCDSDLELSIDDNSSEQYDNDNSNSEQFDSDTNNSGQFDNDNNISEESDSDNSSSEQYDRDFENENDFSEMNESKILYNSFMRPALPYPMPIRVPQTSSTNNHQMFNDEIRNDRCSTEKVKKSIFDSSKSSSFLYNSVSTLKHESKVKTFITSQVQSVSTMQESIISSFVPPELEDGKKIRDSVYHPLSSGDGCPSYHTIIVNRSTNYTQIILKLTRGRSIFLTVRALTELTDAVIRTGNDTSCGILLLNGIGDSFCLGVDLKSLVGPRKNLTTTEMANAVKEFIEALSHFKKPVAAVVNGPAIGLGMTLLNHVDFTIASDTATFCMPHVFLGYMPEGGATLTLPQAVGSTVATDLLLRGRQLSAQQALDIGLISDVVKTQCLPEELVSRVQKMAGGSLSALETTKSILKMQLHVNLRLVLENEVKLLPRMWLTRTCQDAMRKAMRSGLLSE